MNNIRNTEDAFERYKMPQMSFRFKHQGQYNQTFITNVHEIAKAVHIDVVVMNKYFAIRLNTQCKIANGELTLKGNFTENVLQQTLRDFIKHYILCHNCDLPELNYLSKKKCMRVQCRACGYSESADLDDRVYKAVHNLAKMTQGRKQAIPIPVPTDICCIPIPNEVEVEWSTNTSEEAILHRKENAFGDSKLLYKQFK